MRLLNLLFQSAKRWCLGLGLGKHPVGHDPEPRDIVELTKLKNELVAQRATTEAARRDCDVWRDAANKLAELLHSEKKSLATEIADLKKSLAKQTELVKTIQKLGAETWQEQTFEALRKEIGQVKADRDALMIKLELEQREHHKQKNATAQMWKFIHTRHRLNVPSVDGTIRQVLMQSENRK